MAEKGRGKKKDRSWSPSDKQHITRREEEIAAGPAQRTEYAFSSDQPLFSEIQGRDGPANQGQQIGTVPKETLLDKLNGMRKQIEDCLAKIKTPNKKPVVLGLNHQYDTDPDLPRQIITQEDRKQHSERQNMLAHYYRLHPNVKGHALFSATKNQHELFKTLTTQSDLEGVVEHIKNNPAKNLPAPEQYELEKVSKSISFLLRHELTNAPAQPVYHNNGPSIDQLPN